MNITVWPVTLSLRCSTCFKTTNPCFDSLNELLQSLGDSGWSICPECGEDLELIEIINSKVQVVYQLSATGRLHPNIGLDGREVIVSHHVFTDIEAAEKHIPAFLESCVAPKSMYDLAYLDPETTKIEILELLLDP